MVMSKQHGQVTILLKRKAKVSNVVSNKKPTCSWPIWEASEREPWEITKCLSSCICSVYLRTSPAPWLPGGRNPAQIKALKIKGLSFLLVPTVPDPRSLNRDQIFSQPGRHWWRRLWSPQTRLRTFPWGFLAHGKQNFVGWLLNPHHR